MTQTLAARPAPVSRVWAGSKTIAENVEGEDLGDVLEMHADACAWWVLPRGGDVAGHELRRASQALGIDELAIRDLLANDHRAKYEELGRAQLVMTEAVSVDRKTAELTAHPVSLVMTSTALICLVDDAPGGLQAARLLNQKAQLLEKGGTEHALQLVLSAVIASYEDVVEWLEDCSDQLAEALFQERPLSRTEQIWAFRVRTALSQLRRKTDPMRTVMDELVEHDGGADFLGRKWSMIRDQHHRVANAADALRDALTSVMDTSLALADLRMNTIMKKLTGWAGIIAVPTLVTGFVGMNVNFPLDGTAAGFWVYSAIGLVAIVWLYLTFKHKDWI